MLFDLPMVFSQAQHSDTWLTVGHPLLSRDDAPASSVPDAF
jgi:hypothetical protein